MINFSALREAFNASLIKKACAIANSKKFKDGDYDHAYAAIEKLKKGLADEPKVAACLKKANESIALAEDDLEEGVAVDMRTKGYKEAIARGLSKEAKKKLKAENSKTLQDANNALLGKNENMTAGGNDSTGPIAGHDKPLSKKKKIMKRKGFKESIELEEVFNQAQMKKAIGIARKSRGNYDKAYAEIEKIKKGLGDEDIIAHVLKKANESVELDESKLGDDKGLLKLAKGPSSKFPMGVGGPDRDDLIWAADMIKHNDIKGIQSHLGMLDTPVRDAVLKFVDKNTKTKLGYRDITYESVDLDEAVTVDMRTKGYKEAIARGLLKASKNVKKSEIDEILDAANKHIMGENEGMTAAGSDSTGAIDGYDKPLGKTKKRKSFKESIELEEGFRVVGVTTSGEKFKTGLLKTKKDADNKHWKLTKATDLRGKKVYKTLKVVKESIELEEGANLQIFKDSGYMMQRNGKGSTFTIFYGKKAVAHGQSKGGKVNPATVNKNTTLTWTIPSKNNMTTPLSGVDAVKYLKKNLIESVELDEGMQLKGIYKALKSLATKPEYKKVKNALNGLADFPPSGSEKKAATSLKKRLGQLSKLVKGKKEQQKLMKLADFTATFESIELDEAYDRGSIRDFKVGDKVKFVDDKSSHHGQTGKITKLIGGIGARQKAHVKLDKTKKTVIDILTSTDLIKESVEINEAVLDEGVSSEAKSVMREINKHLKILKTELKTSDENQDWKARLNRIEGIIGKVKWTVEESLDEAKGSDCTIQNDGRNNIAVCIDGLSFADARKGTRGAMMNINDFKKKAKVAWADAKGKPTIPAVKKEIKALKAKNFYAKWQADSSSYKDDSVKIWFTK